MASVSAMVSNGPQVFYIIDMGSRWSIELPADWRLMARDAFNPDLVLETLGAQNLAEHVPLSVLWACINEAAGTIIDEHPLSHSAGLEGGELAVEPGVVHADEVPDIEVLEG